MFSEAIQRHAGYLDWRGLILWGRTGSCTTFDIAGDIRFSVRRHHFLIGFSSSWQADCWDLPLLARLAEDIERLEKSHFGRLIS